MSQATLSIGNVEFPPFRAALNLALAAIASAQSGATAPSAPTAGMMWLDTAADPALFKIRNVANDAWITAVKLRLSDNTGRLDAANIDVLDAGAFFAGATVEAVLAELATLGQGRHAIWLPASAFVPTDTSGAADGAGELPTNDVPRAYLDFNPSSIEWAGALVAAPKSADESAGFYAQFFWQDAATASSGNVVWRIHMLAAGDGDSLDAAHGAQVSVTDGFLATKQVQRSDETTVIDPAGTWAAGDLISIKISRNASDAADTYGQDARFLGVLLHYVTNAATDD